MTQSESAAVSKLILSHHADGSSQSGKLDSATGGYSAPATKKVNQATQGASKTAGDAGKSATSAASKAGNNVSNTASGAIGDLTKTGTDTWNAASKGDIKGAFGGVAKGAGATVGGVGSGVSKTADDAGKGANKLVSGAGKNIGACYVSWYHYRRARD
jgi:phage-related protein